jgi:Domain of unknown function (DUF3387)
MGEPTLRVIAHELVASIKSSVSVDWMHREAARARMRVLVKRLLRKYGYPPTCRMRLCSSRDGGRRGTLPFYPMISVGPGDSLLRSGLLGILAFR